MTFRTLSPVVTLPTIDRRQKSGVLGRPNDGQPGIPRVCSNLTAYGVYVVEYGSMPVCMGWPLSAELSPWPQGGVVSCFVLVALGSDLAPGTC